jgi:hypothetical protein
MLAEADAVHADLVGKDGLLDHIPDHLRVGQRLAVGISLDVAEGIQTKLNLLAHQFIQLFPVWTAPPAAFVTTTDHHDSPAYVFAIS